MHTSSEHLAQEYLVLKAPFEYHVQLFKRGKRELEKQISLVLNTLIVQNGNSLLTKRDAQDTIECLIHELKERQVEYEKVYLKELSLYNESHQRIKHLKLQADNLNGSKEAIDSYIHDKLNRGIISFLYSKKFFSSADKLTNTLNLGPVCLLEKELYQEYHTILESLNQESCGEALKWTSNYRSRLIKIGSDLEFQLIFQQFIELLKNKDSFEALKYLRKTSKYFQKSNHSLVMKAMGCLLVDNLSGLYEMYKDFFDASRWLYLSELFRSAYAKIMGIKQESALEIFLSTGLSTLKTPFCKDPLHQKPDACPLCNKWMLQLSSKIPSTQKSMTSIVCRITGELINENNPAVVLPNDQVFSLKGIQQLCDNENKFICPITSTRYSLNDVTKIYLT